MLSCFNVENVTQIENFLLSQTQSEMSRKNSDYTQAVQKKIRNFREIFLSRKQIKASLG